jgi:hypothetical protein
VLRHTTPLTHCYFSFACLRGGGLPGVGTYVTPSLNQCVTHMLYADDLTLTANDPVQLQKMLRRLESYAARKGLTVNVQKSYIVNFNAYRNSAAPIFVSTIKSLEREIILPTWECYLVST